VGARVFDVRRPGEYRAGHVPGAVNVPLETLGPAAGAGPIPGVTPGQTVAVLCQSGYRSAIASSLLAARHDGPIVNVIGGTAAWLAAGYPDETMPSPDAATR
jgi:rhodanese-related sulfurtransferase